MMSYNKGEQGSIPHYDYNQAHEVVNDDKKFAVALDVPQFKSGGIQSVYRQKIPHHQRTSGAEDQQRPEAGNSYNQYPTMSRAQTRMRRRKGDTMTWKERWTVFKHNRRKPGLITNSTKGDDEPLFEANSLTMVLIAVLGRMANVVGTMKMYK
ncbi:hypothetical protein TELCIR_01614, partial [Teladorsagia circumcincta]